MASPPPALLLVFFFAASFPPLSSCDRIPFREINLRNPVLYLTLPLVDESSSNTKNVVSSSSCERVGIVGLSRMQLTSYPNSLHVLVNASEEMPEWQRKKVELCFHRNISAGLCHCEIDSWKSLKMGQWSTVMSPYDTKLIDIKISSGKSGSFTVSIEEEIQHWRLFFLGIGFVLLLLAPVISNWVPFYYSSSMVLGILLVVLLLLFQGKKLLPNGRRSILSLTLFSSVIGLGSWLAHYFSVFVNSIIVSFGLSEEMHNPVSIFAIMFVAISGAAVGFWMVRKFVLSEDGGVDNGIAQFVKWAMRVFGMMFILQSSGDTILAATALVLCWNMCLFIASLNWRRIIKPQRSNSMKGSIWQNSTRRLSASHRNAEFLSPPDKIGSRRMDSGSRSAGQRWSSSPVQRWSKSPVKGLVLSHPQKAAATSATEQENYYSTFHRTPTRRFSKKEWEDFTQESTRNALVQWASSPQVADWIAENARRIHLTPRNNDSDGEEESSSGSSEEVVEDSPGIFGWL